MLPVAVHKGKDFAGGVAIEAQPEPRNIETSQSTALYTMFGKGYTVYEIDYAQYSNVTDSSSPDAVNTKGLMRYRASKAPAAIRKHASENSVLHEAFVFSITDELSPDVVFVARYTVDNEQKYYMFISENTVGNDVAIMRYCSNIKEVPKAFNKFYEPTYKSIGLAVYCKEQYEVVVIDESWTVDEFIGMHSDEVVISATRIKPSKAPAQLKNVISKPINYIVRVTLSDNTIVFVFACQDSKTMLMRIE
jgi:hypothetical protein